MSDLVGNTKTRQELRSGGAFLERFFTFIQSMQRFVPRALFKMAAPFDILSVLLGRNGNGRNGYWPKWFWAENVQMTSDAFIFNYAPVLARVLTQNGRLKIRTPFLFA